MISSPADSSLFPQFDINTGLSGRSKDKW